jgi:beta-galactosidase
MDEFGESIMLVGAYYYPEHWPREQWERDIGNIAKMGFDFTHFGEFAWAFMEPEEGKYDFEWLDEAVAIASKNGLKVIMCTPTPTPPAWMAEKYPEILMSNSDSRIVRHGTRQHVSWSSTKYQEFTKQIVTKLAERYGRDERIWGWQIDNEPSHYGLKEDYGDAAQARFRQWLKDKYQTIERLNDVWGTKFWSELYSSFDQIRIPNEKELVLFFNPHAILDFKRFTASEAAAFVSLQYNILRKTILKEQWITTNFMAIYDAVDPKLNDDLDFITWTKYPVEGFNQGIGEQGFRRGLPYDVGFGNDFFRPLKAKTAAMELQISQVCWGEYNPRIYPGARRLLLYHVFAGGNSFVCSYRFRQATFNYEQNIIGMVGTDGVTPSDGGREYMEFIKEMKTLQDNRPEAPKKPEPYFKRKSAVIWSFDNLWATDYQQHTTRWSYRNHHAGYYNILKSFGCPVDIIRGCDDFSAYSVLIAPAQELINAELIDKFSKYVNNGGNLVLTCRSGAKDENGHYWEAKRAEPLWELIGAEIEFFDNLPGNCWANVRFGKQDFKWNIWADVLSPHKDTAVLATYVDQFYQGKAAVVSREYGKGSVTYIGVESSENGLERTVLKHVYNEAKIPIEDYPNGIIVDWRDGFWIAMNYSSEPFEVAIPKNAEILIGQKTLNAADVVVWSE